MSANGFAGKDAFQRVSGKTRYTTIQVPQIGTVRLRSLTALDYAQIEALTVKAAMAARGNSTTRQVRALAESGAELIRLCVVDGEGNPVFGEDDRNTLLNMDSSVSQAIVSGAMEFCGIDGADLETIAKNSAKTADASSQSA
jgi:hypothetical protein